jgi:hypothetical protein
METAETAMQLSAPDPGGYFIGAGLRRPYKG